MLRSFSSQNQELTDVGLIALINFDTEFALPDFRNRERAFTLLFRLLQQAQRNQARVVIQTYRPDDPVLSFALAGDMAGFMNWELKMRQEPGFPPYRRLVAINIKAQDEKTLRQETGVILARFKNLAGVVPSVTAGAFEVLGPAFSSTFSARIILKLPRQVLPGKVIDLNWLEKLRVRVRVDVDPVKILPF
jgi:primosomal protein N' (replication factor Y)